MKKFLNISIVSIAFTIFGCANAQVSQQVLQQETQNFLRSMYYRLQIDGEVSKLSTKIWLDDIKKTPLPYYANSEKVSSEEKPAIERLNQLNTIFNEERSALISKYNLPIVDLLSLSAAASSSLIVDLYVGKLTYGEYAIKKRDLSNNFDSALLERGRQVTAAEKVQRDAAFNGLQNYLINQNLINTLNQPARISPFTCSRLGTMVNCW